MTDFETTPAGELEFNWEKPEAFQVEITQLLAPGLPHTRVPSELRSLIYDHILEEWSSVTTDAEDNVLLALLDLTIDRNRRHCSINPDDHWSIMQTVLYGPFFEKSLKDMAGKCGQELHLEALRDLIHKGLVNRTLCGDRWVCSINYLWNPGYECLSPLAGFSEQATDFEGSICQGCGGRDA